jgi:hypothetical protein
MKRGDGANHSAQILWELVGVVIGCWRQMTDDLLHGSLRGPKCGWID